MQSLRTLRQRLGLSQAALAQALGISTVYIKKVEAGQRTLSLPLVLKLAALTGEPAQCPTCHQEVAQTEEE